MIGVIPFRSALRRLLQCRAGKQGPFAEGVVIGGGRKRIAGRTCRRGSMSIMIVILGVSAVLMIMSGLSLTTGATAVQRGALAREQATFLADAGLEHAMIHLKNNPGWRDGYTNQPLGSGTYTVALVDDAGDVIVTSTGAVAAFSVQVSIRIGWGT